ncbi:hypothetical protein [Thermomonas sp. HDW16]|uniref:hypothetical protein n=1 Tax=Thermomonas sp. HDW16 TaxID=2714945 RepID=UPI00140B84C1|nr:hypothetical protein [Thermomonas sp. HDW16]QIL21118.1 hypothetical protein G7079_10465 [Thermomonas sp. HDW16]
MKLFKFALVAILLPGALSACKPHESAAPAAEAMPAAAEPAATAAPANAEPAAAAPATETPPADASKDDNEDSPQSGGDKIGNAPAPAEAPSH